VQQSKILIVDDEVELVTTLVERLEWRGYSAEGVTDGHDALHRLAGGGFDIIVVDLKMPGLSGLDVVDATRRRFPHVAVLLITGHGADTDEGQEVLPAADEVLLKPFKLDVLIEKVDQIRAARGGKT
jgi:CheY-like chemotaxis protein